MIQIINAFRKANLKIQALISLAGILFYMLTSYLLERSYAQSKFPVPYFEQQTSFNASKMKQWYGYMIEQNTFDIYFITQLIDFAFIAAVVISGFALWTFLANCFPYTSRFRNIGIQMGFTLPIAGAFDILENIVSFFMIAQPATFDSWIIIPYSTFASLKFAFWCIGLIWLGAAVSYLPIARILIRKNIQSA